MKVIIDLPPKVLSALEKKAKKDNRSRKNFIETILIQFSEGKTDNTIIRQMDADMCESGFAQGEIESCLNHWSNQYLYFNKY